MSFKTLMGVAAAAATLAAPALAKDVIYSTHTPATYPDNAYTATRMFDRIKEATGGDMNVNMAAGGALAGAGAALAAVKSGAVDSAMVIYNYTPSDLPVLGLLGDLYSTDARIAGPAVTETMLLNCPECKEEMDRQNMTILFNNSSPAYNLLCTKDRVENLADAKGLKIRAVGSFGPLAAAIGATPVNITYSEIYEALQRGQIDCAMNDASQVKALQLDFLKYVTEVPLGTFQSIGFVAVNNDVWDGFSADEQMAWKKSANQALTDATYEFTNRVSGAREVAENTYGTEFVTPGADLMKAVQDYRANETPSLIERAKGRGVKNPEAITTAFAEATAKWSKIVAEIGEGEWTQEQWDAYTAKTWDEIFSKAEY